MNEKPAPAKATSAKTVTVTNGYLATVRFPKDGRLQRMEEIVTVYMPLELDIDKVCFVGTIHLA